MKPIYRRFSIFVVAIVVVAVGYFGYRFYVASQRSVPQEFSEARSQGAVISEKIISSSNDIAASVAQLGSSTSTPAKASSTLGEVLTKAADVRAQALELSALLETMTRALPNIRSTAAQQAAFEAIRLRLALVSRLITYTDEVTRLAAAIRLHLQTNAQNSGDIANLIRQINSEVTAANSLSIQADEAMKKFDSLLR